MKRKRRKETEAERESEGKRERGGRGVVFLLVTRNSVLPLRGIRWLSLHPLWTFHLPRPCVTPLQPTSNPPTTLTRQISLASRTSPNWYESSLSTSFLPFYGKWRAESRERRSHLRETQRRYFFGKVLRGTRAMLFSPPFSHRNFTHLYFENEVTIPLFFPVAKCTIFPHFLPLINLRDISICSFGKCTRRDLPSFLR